MIGIYKITNTLTNEFYIGKSNNIERRFMEHNTPKNKKYLIDIDIKKYGKENFKYEVIIECSIEELDTLEKRYIEELKPKYNVVHVRKTATKEFKEKVSKGTKRWWGNLPKETQNKIIKNNLTNRFKKGHVFSEETIAKIKANHKPRFKPVRIVELDMTFKSVNDCEAFLNACAGTIAAYFKGKLKTVKGYQIEKV